MRDVHGKGLLTAAERAEVWHVPVQADQTKQALDEPSSPWSLGPVALPRLDLPQCHAEQDLHRQAGLDRSGAVDRLPPTLACRLRSPRHVRIEPDRQRSAALERVRHCARTNGASTAHYTRASSGSCRCVCALCSSAQAITLDSQDESLKGFVQQSQYHPRFSRWREVFGDRFELWPMIRAQLHQNCVVRDFLGFAFQSTDFKLKVEPESNMSLSVEYLSLLLHLHKHLAMLPQDAKAQETIGRNFAIVMSAVPLQKSTKLAMTAQTFARVREMYEADAVALDRDFFYRRPDDGGHGRRRSETGGSAAIV